LKFELDEPVTDWNATSTLMTFFFNADAAMMANVDFPEPRSPTKASEASELKPGILPLVGVRGGVGVLDAASDPEFELMKAYGRSRSTLSGPSLLIMVANDLLTPAMMPHSACGS
jgi:hypothetical protein